VAERSMKWTLNDLHSLNYIMTYEDTPDSFFWRKLNQFTKKKDRRSQPRPADAKRPNKKI